MQVNLNSYSPKFRARMASEDYSPNYSKYANYNGSEPDIFVLNRLNQVRKPAIVFDLGAGQGRNTIPIAKQGYSVYAYEISSVGRDCIKTKAINNRVLDKVIPVGCNILDNVSVGGEADFMFMSHISQHLNIEELRTVFKNAYDNLKVGGEFILDAITTQIQGLASMYAGKMPEICGEARYDENELVQTAKDVGFMSVIKKPFVERGQGRPGYEIPWLRDKNFKLNWFVLKK